MTFKLRPADACDASGLEALLAAVPLFAPEMLIPMMTPFLEGREDQLWLICLDGGEVVGFCYAEAEAMTEGTWNMRALAVHPARHRAGIGRRLVTALEDRLRRGGQRLLVVDTASGDDLAAARAFYTDLGYTLEARIAGFWAEGEDKLTFTKGL